MDLVNIYLRVWGSVCWLEFRVRGSHSLVSCTLLYCSISVHVPLYSVAGRHLSSINTMVCATLSLLDSSESIHSPHVPAVKSMGRNGMRCQPSLTPEAD